MAGATAKLDLPFLFPNQAQKHVTYNQAVGTLDVLVQLSVMARDLDEPPTNLAEGDCYIIGPSPAGPWAGKSGDIAAFVDGMWSFYKPKEGTRVRGSSKMTSLLFTRQVAG